MTTAADRTLGELARRLDEVVSRFEALANRLDTTYLRQEMFTSYQRLADAERARLVDAITLATTRLDSLEDGRRWVTRSIVGCIITALTGLALAARVTGLR